MVDLESAFRFKIGHRVRTRDGARGMVSQMAFLDGEMITLNAHLFAADARALAGIELGYVIRTEDGRSLYRRENEVSEAK